MKKCLLQGIFALCIFLFWFLGHPEAISYQEQYQLFLFDFDYLFQRLGVAGGFCDYVAEFLVQFYYVTVLGAVILTLIYVAFQALTWRTLRMFGVADSYYGLSFSPSLLLLAYMGDENVLLSFPFAIIAVLALVLFSSRIGRFRLLFQALIIPVVYWLFGPVVIVYAFVVGSYSFKSESDKVKASIISASVVAYAFISIYVLSSLFISQFPWPDVWGGINYHRNRLTYPLMQFVIEALVAILPLVASCLPHMSGKWPGYVVASVVVVACSVLTWFSYDTDKYLQLRYDYLTRYERWDDIIKSAERYMPETPMAANSVNLALAMTGQLGDRMFEFFQCGGEGLFSQFSRNMVSCVPTAETYYRLGMVNSAQRCYFDSQEAILNNRKSGRMTQRIAETYIVNGRYDVARKYLADLKKTVFYSDWASEAERCLGDVKLLNLHKTIGRLRQIRYKEDFLYSSAEMTKMLAVLWNQNKSNRIAFDYMMANIMLECDMQAFNSLAPFIAQQNYSHVPLHYQEVAAMFMMQGVNVPGVAVSEQVRRDVKEFDNFYLMNSNLDKLRQSRWGKSYWVYCMVAARAARAANASTGATTPTHR